MIPMHTAPVSFSGHPLGGENLVRMVYLDEAGTSAGDPVAVVAGIVVHGDSDWKALERAISSLKEKYIPAEDRGDFVFHAKDIFQGTGYFIDRERWSREMRIEILRDLISPVEGVNFSVCFGFWRKGKLLWQDSALRDAKARHVMAYIYCMTGVELYMREYASNELAMMIAEDTPDMKRNIRKVHEGILSEKEDSEIPDERLREVIPFRHIVESVYFAEKQQSALLQFADSYAFTFRRFLSSQSHADRLMEGLFSGDDLFLMARQPFAYGVFHRQGRTISEFSTSVSFGFP